MESDIFSNLKTRLTELAWPAYIEYENIRLLTSDFLPHEIPAIQFFDAGQLAIHVQSRVQVTWGIDVEIMMKQTVADVVNQSVLFERANDVLLKIGANVQMDLGSSPASQGTMIHIKYLGMTTDIHTLRPFYLATLNFQAQFLKPYTAEC